MAEELGITADKHNDMAAWYEQVCLRADMADFGEIRGTIVIKPKGYYIWEQIQEYFNKEILQPYNVDNAYFPLFIPERFFKKEAEHAEGFAPELAWVTTSVDTGDEDKAIVRPTSETIIVDSFRKWLRTYKDLPIKINQWANIVRWEVSQTKMFLRGREFLWQEGHCIYEGEEECEKDELGILDEYQKLCKNVLAVPVIKGEKTPAERFPGAVRSYTIEGLMPDGKALQMGTSHYLGQGFMKVFDVKYTGCDEEEHLPHYNSWGVSTRLIGAAIMTHSDNKGLVLPPRLLKKKIVVIPAIKKHNTQEVMAYAQRVADTFKEYGAYVDSREGYSMGWKINDAELHGVPMVIIVGAREMEQDQITVKMRDLQEKSVYDLADFK
ncbi:MAG: aminoacyl--tRNA ligase-related protein, partial [Nanoarchaeota archaeon]